MKKIILILLVFVSSSVFADRNSSVVINRAENNISGIQRSVLNRASVISNKSKRSDNSNNISRQKSYRSLNNQNKSSVIGRSAKNQVVRSSNTPKQTKVNSVNRQIKTENLRHTNKNITSRSAVSNLKKTFVNNVGVKQSYSVLNVWMNFVRTKINNFAGVLVLLVLMILMRQELAYLMLNKKCFLSMKGY